VLARLRSHAQVLYRWMGRIGVAFVVLFLGYFAIEVFAPRSGFRIVIGLGLLVAGVWLAIRMLRMVARQAVWRLRNRLLVTYLFIAAVPILLIISLAVVGGMLLAQQLAVYLVTSELDRRIESLDSAAQSIVRTTPADRPAVMEGMVRLFYRDRFPGIEILAYNAGRAIRYPADGTLVPPSGAWQSTRGVLLHDDRFYLWSFVKSPAGDVTVVAPLTSDLLAGLVPHLGLVDFQESDPSGRARISVAKNVGNLPLAVNRFDYEFLWFATLPMAEWNAPSKSDVGYLVVRSRASAVLNAVFNRKADLAQGVLVIILIIGLIVFVIVELVSVIIGISMTRTITGAVHRLYQGTQKVIEGDFSHRIDVTGKDQLAELSSSFNSMTENLERLLVVAKEKERLQSEIEIAREVQSQLFPRVVPKTRTLQLTAICQPARMVSGDYYDYEIIRDSQVALAIGDVAGKGISAALLMATLQSSLRTQLQSWLEVAAVAGNGNSVANVSTSHLVSRLNTQLHAYTSPEKYATFCLGVLDESTGGFTYTNAGHLPPLLVRDGVPERLDVNGTVVGAFPFSTYGESRVNLNAGDVLVCFTDGITEPENEYGEMYGEDRLADLIAKNIHRTNEQIIEMVLSSVHQWTASEELQDDMTILIARRT
jgi:sigma-B regulation protein RsbU (phosphoserine phosphatase)